MTEQTMTPGEVLRVLDDCASKLDFHYRDTRSGDEMRTAFPAVAALIAERDGYKAGWWDVVEMLGGKKLDISNAQYHASVLAPKIRELIARNAELEADNKALRERSKRLLDAYDYSANEFESAQAAEGVRELIDAARAEADHG
jgi:hypothetical protein